MYITSLTFNYTRYAHSIACVSITEQAQTITSVLRRIARPALLTLSHVLLDLIVALGKYIPKPNCYMHKHVVSSLLCEVDVTPLIFGVPLLYKTEQKNIYSVTTWYS